MSRAPRMRAPIKPNLVQRGLTFRTFFKSAAITLDLRRRSYDTNSPPFEAISFTMLSAAKIPESIALWFPFIRGTFTSPAAQPIMAPPGNESFGIDCQPPSEIALAPYAILFPPSKSSEIFG